MVCSMVICGQLAAMAKTHTEQQQQFTLQNHLYEPLVLRYIHPITEQVVIHDIRGHERTEFKGTLPEMMLIMLKAKFAQKCQKHIMICPARLAEDTSVVHILRERSRDTGIACYETNCTVVELKNWLFEQRSKTKNEIAPSHITSDEKSKE